jgi:inosose dehydratase
MTETRTNGIGSSLRIGTAPVNWNNFDLSGWRPVVPFPAILDEMRAAGYEATEWDQSFGSDIDALNRERTARGITFTGAYRWLDFLDDDQFANDLAEVAPFLATLQGIGATHLVVADSLRPHRVALAGSIPADGSASLKDDGYDRIIANLARLAAVAAPFGLDVHYHNHVGSYVEAPDEVGQLVRRLDATPVDLCFDTGHYAFGGGDALAFVREHRAAIGYMHLKDVDDGVLTQSRANRWSFHDALQHIIFSPIGQGSAQIDEIVGLLVRHGFDGYVIIEQDTCRDDSTTNSRANLQTVQQYAREAARNKGDLP